MMFKDLVLKNRSYRRFYQDAPVEMETLRHLVALARTVASPNNIQPLKYLLICDPDVCAGVYETLAWAGYLKDWDGPVEGERPAAYIVLLGDTTITRNFAVDEGIAAQTILLGATEMGLGGCMLGAIKREQLRTLLNISAQYEIVLVVALGKPKETVIIDEVGPAGDIKYWRDADGGHHVPKRRLADIIIEEKG
jgi:nitroreductase